MSPKRIPILIVNSKGTGNGHTSLRNARRLVARGLARWNNTSGTITMIEDTSDYREAAAISAVRLAEIGYDCSVQCELVRSFRALKNLPIVGEDAPQKLLARKRA